MMVSVRELNRKIASAQDYKICRQVMRSASQNYTFANAFLPANRRAHVEALYAFLRVGDDRVDVSHSGFSTPLAAITDWEDCYWQAFATGGSSHPVVRAYLNTAMQFNIPKEIMVPYFRAMRDDLTITRFPTFADLIYYIEGSAMVVGRTMTYILGVRPPNTLTEALPKADSLSVAMQLCNIWRDIGPDWRMGRVYLPLEDLDRFGVSENDLAKARINQQFIDLLEFEIERTEQYYNQAQPGIKMLASGRWGIQCGLEVYRAILTGIRRNHYDVFTHRAGASSLERIGLVARAWWQSRSL